MNIWNRARLTSNFVFNLVASFALAFASAPNARASLEAAGPTGQRAENQQVRCVDCDWLESILGDDADEDAESSRSARLMELNKSDLGRAVKVLSLKLKSSQIQEAARSLTIVRLLADGHKDWSCSLTEEALSAWPKEVKAPGPLIAAFGALSAKSEVIVASKCKRSFSGETFLKRALNQKSPMGVRVSILDGLLATEFHPSLPAIQQLLKDPEPSLRLYALDWLARDYRRHSNQLDLLLKTGISDKVIQVQARTYRLIAKLPAATQSRFWSAIGNRKRHCDSILSADVRSACLSSIEVGE